MPVTIPNENNAKRTLKMLRDYYNSLNHIFKNQTKKNISNEN